MAHKFSPEINWRMNRKNRTRKKINQSYKGASNFLKFVGLHFSLCAIVF